MALGEYYCKIKRRFTTQKKVKKEIATKYKFICFTIENIFLSTRNLININPSEDKLELYVIHIIPIIKHKNNKKFSIKIICVWENKRVFSNDIARKTP